MQLLQYLPYKSTYKFIVFVDIVQIFNIIARNCTDTEFCTKDSTGDGTVGISIATFINHSQQSLCERLCMPVTPQSSRFMSVSVAVLLAEYNNYGLSEMDA